MKVRERSRNDAGFTLIELLVAVAVTAILTGFLLGAIEYAQRFWSLSQNRSEQDEIDAGAMQLRSLLSHTISATAFDPIQRIAHLLFEGGPDHLTFVALSEATAFQGGLVRVRLGREDDARANEPPSLKIRTKVFRAISSAEAETGPAVLLRNVSNVSFSYFGVTKVGQAAEWRSTWTGQDRLPTLVRAKLDIGNNGNVRRLDLFVTLRMAFN